MCLSLILPVLWEWLWHQVCFCFLIFFLFLSVALLTMKQHLLLQNLALTDFRCCASRHRKQATLTDVKKQAYGYQAGKWGVEIQNEKLTLAGANVAGGFKWRLMFMYHSKYPRALKNFAKPTLPVFCKATTKPGWLNICLQYGLLLWSAQKRFLSKHYCSLTMLLVTQELWWRRATRLTSFSCLLT